MPNLSQDQFQLSEVDNQFIFDRRITRSSLRNATPVTTPTALFLGGQPGSGKSGLAQFHLKQFADRGGVVLINSDALREYHPDFAHLQRTDADRASFLVNPDTVIWQQKLIGKAISVKCNLLLDGTLGGNAEPILQTMNRLRSEGYIIQVSLLAVPAYQSRLGIYKRYEDQVATKGAGRWVGMGTHDSVYAQLPDRLDQLEQQQLIDEITVYARPVGNQPPALIYENKLADGSWANEPQAGQALTAHRNRLLTYAEYKAHKATVQAVQWQLEQTAPATEKVREFLSQVEQTAISHRLATATDARLYFNWANEPVTRQQSFNSTPILWEDHEAWFNRKVNDQNALLLVFEAATGEPTGQVRFEKQADGEVIIGVSVDNAFRGQGLASQLISEGCQIYRTMRGDSTSGGEAARISAYIKPENKPSIRAFERAGFIHSHKSRKFGVESVCLILPS